MACCDLKKGKCALSGYVIYLITVMATSQSFCFALLSLSAYNLSPRAKGHFSMLTLIVVSTCQNEISFGGLFYSRWHTASAPLPGFYHYPSSVLLSFPILGIMQVFCNILKLIKASKTPCLIIHHRKRVVSTIQTALWCCPVVSLEFYYLKKKKVLVFTQWNLFMLNLYEQWMAPCECDKGSEFNW